MVSEDPIYRELQKAIDKRMPIGFPATDDGKELHLLKLLFRPEEAKIAIFLRALPESLKKIHRKVNKKGISIALDELEEILDKLVEKGAIMGGALLNNKEKNIKNYSLAQWALGMYEFQLGRMTKEFAELAYKYNLGTFYQEFFRKDTPTQWHTIPIEKSLTPEHHVGTYDNIREIIMNKVEKIALIDCVCRQQHDLLEESCKLSDVRRCCVSFNDNAEATIEDGNGKEVSKEEFFDILNKYQKEGFILQPSNTQNPNGMCICCGCCCQILRMVKQFPRPAEYYFSNFYAQSDPELCNGCETCLKRCQMDAITMVDDKSSVDLDRCIGCGNCVATCGMKAMSLYKKEKEVVPPKNTEELYQKIWMKKMGFPEQ